MAWPKSTSLRRWARHIKSDLVVLYLAARDPRTPWYVKALVGLIIAYALSPIDLIPDFIPVLGYVDDLIIVPLGLVLVFRLIPREIVEEHRAEAARMGRLPASRRAAIVIIAIWLVLAIFGAGWAYRLLWKQ